MTKHTILFLAANPVGTDRLALDQEARAIRVALERSGHRDNFELVTRWAAQPLDLLEELRKLKPTVVHFSGHSGRGEPRSDAGARRDIVGESRSVDGDHQHGLFFQGPDGRPQLVSTAALGETFSAAGSSVKLVVLNACYSDVQAEALLAHVDCVVGMGGSINDGAARNFAIGFYGGLGERESVAAAYQQGCAAIGLEGLPDSDKPRLRVGDEVDAALVVLADSASCGPAAPSRGDDRKQGLSQVDEFDVFICYNSADIDKVKQYAKRLRENGQKPWLDSEQLQLGESPLGALQAQIGAVKAATLVVGNNGLGPLQMLQLDVLLRERVKRRYPLIPMLLPDSPVHVDSPPVVDGRVDFRDRAQDSIVSLKWGITGKGSGDETRGQADAPRTVRLTDPWTLFGRSIELAALGDASFWEQLAENGELAVRFILPSGRFAGAIGQLPLVSDSMLFPETVAALNDRVAPGLRVRVAVNLDLDVVAWSGSGFELAAQEIERDNLIVSATGDINLVTRLLVRDWLPAHHVPGPDRPEASEIRGMKGLYAHTHNPRVGLLAVMRSPFNSRRIMIQVAGSLAIGTLGAQLLLNMYIRGNGFGNNVCDPAVAAKVVSFQSREYRLPLFPMAEHSPEMDICNLDEKTIRLYE